MITVLGASGFIGSRLVEVLQQRRIDYYAPHKEERLSGKYLGNIIYCIGLTADFRSKSFETVNAHVCKLLNILQKCEFDSLLYLSSTRLYKSKLALATEEDKITVNPLNNDDLYNISKAMGESITLASARKTRIVRISNVYGNDVTSGNFIPSILKEAIFKRKVMLRTSLETTKDYISINDVANLILEIAIEGRYPIYNVASGTNVSNFELMESISSLTDCQVEVLPEAKTVVFPKISIERIQEDFNFIPTDILKDMPALVNFYQSQGE